MIGYDFYCVHGVAQQIVAAIQYVFTMLFGDHQNMTIDIPGNVHKRKCKFILKHLHAGRIALDNFAENTVCHYIFSFYLIFSNR